MNYLEVKELLALIYSNDQRKYPRKLIVRDSSGSLHEVNEIVQIKEDHMIGYNKRSSEEFIELRLS